VFPAELVNEYFVTLLPSEVFPNGAESIFILLCASQILEDRNRRAKVAIATHSERKTPRVTDKLLNVFLMVIPGYRRGERITQSVTEPNFRQSPYFLPIQTNPGNPGDPCFTKKLTKIEVMDGHD
jgi:hypothetical protein